MRYLLGALAAAGISLTGLIKGRSLTLKCETLNQIIRFLKEFRSRIEYSEEPVSVIIEKFCAGSIRLSFADKCLGYMQEQDFPSAWEKAVGEEKNIDYSDRLLLYEFGVNIGTSDRKSQLSMIDYTLSRFAMSLNEKKEKEKNEKRLYCVTGITLGILAFIMII